MKRGHAPTNCANDQQRALPFADGLQGLVRLLARQAAREHVASQSTTAAPHPLATLSKDS